MLNQTWNDGESNEKATGKAIWKLVCTGCLQRVLSSGMAPMQEGYIGMCMMDIMKICRVWD